jgi:hypothetical protein
VAGTHAVILMEPDLSGQQPRIATAAQALSQVTGQPMHDTTRLLRDASGILQEGLDATTARQTAETLSRNGIEAAALDTAGLPATGKPERVRQVAVEPAGLGVQTGYAGLETVPWGEIQLLNVCLHLLTEARYVEKKPRRRSLRGGGIHRAMHEGLKPRRMEKQLSTDEAYVADIQLLDGRVLRVRSNDCNFSYLGERRLERAEWNFHRFVCDVAEHGVLLAPPAQRFAEGDPLGDQRIEDLHRFEDYNRWLLYVAVAFGGEEDSPDAGGGAAVEDDFAFDDSSPARQGAGAGSAGAGEDFAFQRPATPVGSASAPQPTRAAHAEADGHREETDSGGGFFGPEKWAMGKGVLGGVLLMIIALIWFFGGLAAGYIFFYPPILFIFGVVGVVKGLTQHT